ELFGRGAAFGRPLAFLTPDLIDRRLFAYSKEIMPPESRRPNRPSRPSKGVKPAHASPRPASASRGPARTSARPATGVDLPREVVQEVRQVARLKADDVLAYLGRAVEL